MGVGELEAKKLDVGLSIGVEDGVSVTLGVVDGTSLVDRV